MLSNRALTSRRAEKIDWPVSAMRYCGMMVGGSLNLLVPVLRYAVRHFCVMMIFPVM
jgi:hypothetical protein